MDIRTEIVYEPEDEQRETVYGFLRAFNQESNPEFWDALGREENKPVPIRIFAYDEAGQVVGGLFGSTQFAWLKIDLMAVAEGCRGQGIGRTLLERAEGIGRERGCRHAYVDTMSYQAPVFYQKSGYEIAGKLENWDSHGHHKFLLAKLL